MQVVAVIGLGYVGLPLVVEFGKHFHTIGFDISAAKVQSCAMGIDPCRELSDDEMKASLHAEYTSDPDRLSAADLIVVAVPTPVDEAHIPDFRPLVGACTDAGRHMKKGTTIVFESTVYPGATEEVCIPVLERESGMQWKQDFFVGYSPERINPGDKEHSLTKIIKIVSGDTPATLDRVAKLYETIVIPGVHRASSIKAAEAAKVIENTQRDLNISLMNELSIIFDKIGIDTSEVLAAAGTKWNFLDFKPGLVGGHCIGVDPYYLTHKAEMLGYNPQVILAGRRINDGMGKFIAEQTIKQMIVAGSYVKGAKVNVMGLAFKENCGDLRNSKVIDIINELKTFGVEVFVTDPRATMAEAKHEYGVSLTSWTDLPRADAIVAAVAHREFAEMTVEDFGRKLVRGGVFIDVKSAFDRCSIESAGVQVMASLTHGLNLVASRWDKRPLVLHVVYRFDTGGLENGVANLINHMPSHAYRHAVLALTEVTDFRRRVLRDDVRFIALRKPPGHGFWQYPRLFRIFRQLRPDIVHSRNLAALEVQVPAWAAGVPIRIHGEHGRDLDDKDGNNLVWQRVRCFYRPFVHHYVALSRDLRNYLVEKVRVPMKDISQVYNGVDMSLFHPASDGAHSIAGCPFDPQHHWLVGTVGRMQAIKDPEMLARAFVRAVTMGPELARRMRLVMVGDGPLRTQVQAILDEAGVAHLAWLPGERVHVPDLLRGLHAFALPSLSEGISNAILEAMATALPIVATGVGGNADLVVHGKTGYIVSSADPQGMAMRLVQLACFPEQARSMGLAGRERVSTHFSMLSMIKAYQALYDQQWFRLAARQCHA